MKKINCPCGEKLETNYLEATIVQEPQVLGYAPSFYQWTCHDCGQQFQEMIRGVIKL